VTVSYVLMIALTPAVDPGDPPLPLLTRARLLMYPYVYRNTCREHGLDPEGAVRCSCTPWDDAKVGRMDIFRGYLWRDRDGRPLPDHPVADPEDEPRPATEVKLSRHNHPTPHGVVTPDGEAHYLAGRDAHDFGNYSIAHFRQLQDLITSHPDCMAVPFSCHW
jgi:hypothetical protein